MAIRLTSLGTGFISGEKIKSADFNDTYEELDLRIKEIEFALGKLNNTALTVSLDETSSVLAFGQRYIKSSTTFTTFGISLDTSPSPMNAHTHELSGYNNRAEGTYGAYHANSNDVGTTSYVPKYLGLGAKLLLLPDSGVFSMPEGGVLFLNNNSNDYSFNLLSDYYFGVGYTSDGGSATHTHPNSGYDDHESSYAYYTTIDSVSNEIENRKELFAIYNSGTYDSAQDIIPIGGYILQLVSYSIPSNYQEVDLSGKKGLLRFVKDINDILAEGGTETHTHSVTSLHSANYSPCVGADGSNLLSANHMPPYKAVRVIKRIS